MLLLLTFVVLALSFALWIYAILTGGARHRTSEPLQPRSRWVSHGLPTAAFAANMALLLALLFDPGADLLNSLLNLAGLTLAIGAVGLLKQ